MTAPRLGIAAGNALGADAAAAIAREGGNAVDACLASAVMGWVAEPFFASIGGSGFVSVRTPDGDVEVIDGNQAMPHTVPTEPGQGIKRTYLDYSDGMYTGIGGGSVGVPGILAAVRRAWERHGGIDWEALFAPAIRAAREGFPFPVTSAYYLSVTWNEIWSLYPEAREIFSRDGRPLEAGDPFVQPKLAEALTLLAEEGPRTFYKGTLAAAISDAIKVDGGFMEVSDLERYEAMVRAPISSSSFGWRIDSNPPPASGGTSLIQLLGQLESARLDDPIGRLRAIVEAQRSVASMALEGQEDPDTVVAEELEAPPIKRRSPATTHASSADADGYACSITESNGYGAGLVVEGMLLNNTLGEEELNPLGVHGLQPGARCHSNMAPTIATESSGAKVVALGSPGATRIVGAISQAFLRIAVDDDPLAAAVAAPRAHVDPREAGETLCYEPGLPGDSIDGLLLRPYDEIHMYFGAVQAASVTEYGDVDAAHDPRRSGGSALI
ncbi:MAG: gamma-glutamyltransferase [Actinomycetota bacterium]